MILEEGNHMKCLHYEFDAGPGDIIQVRLDKQANVRLLDGVNYQLYHMGRRYRYIGGLAKRSPVSLRPPHTGHWHVVVDLGGYAGTIKASASVVSG